MRDVPVVPVVPVVPIVSVVTIVTIVRIIGIVGIMRNAPVVALSAIRWPILGMKMRFKVADFRDEMVL